MFVFLVKLWMNEISHSNIIFIYFLGIIYFAKFKFWFYFDIFYEHFHAFILWVWIKFIWICQLSWWWPLVVHTTLTAPIFFFIKFFFALFLRMTPAFELNRYMFTSCSFSDSVSRFMDGEKKNTFSRSLHFIMIAKLI